MTTERSPNLAARLADAARRRPDHPALVWDGGALSWRDLEARAAGLARRLAREQVGAGDVVPLRQPNTWGQAAPLRGGHPHRATVVAHNPSHIKKKTTPP
ncbi:MAG: AMP-binding protein, partial [Candidatus Rokuibacteriota bacterium]